MKGYGLVMPEKENITLAEPELIKHGTKYGIKIKANAPSLHFIKANVSTEIAPIVGTEEQAKIVRHRHFIYLLHTGNITKNIFGII